MNLIRIRFEFEFDDYEYKYSSRLSSYSKYIEQEEKEKGEEEEKKNWLICYKWEMKGEEIWWYVLYIFRRANSKLVRARKHGIPICIYNTQYILRIWWIFQSWIFQIMQSILMSDRKRQKKKIKPSSKWREKKGLHWFDSYRREDFYCKKWKWKWWDGRIFCLLSWEFLVTCNCVKVPAHLLSSFIWWLGRMNNRYSVFLLSFNSFLWDSFAHLSLFFFLFLFFSMNFCS